MPFKSKSQQGRFFAMAGRGEMPMATAKEFAHETPNMMALPEKVSKKRKAKKKMKSKMRKKVISEMIGKK